MIYCHDPFFTIGANAFVELVKEFLVAISVKFGWSWLSVVKENWQPANIWLNLFFTSAAAFIGSWIIRILSSPRMIVYPYEDLQRISSEYNIKELQMILLSSKNNSNRIYSENEINYIRWKYFIQLTCISWTTSFVFFIEENEYVLPKDYKKNCFRLDWILYFLLQIILLIIIYNSNYATEFERNIIWKNNILKYKLLHYLIGLSLIVCLLPSVCMYKQPKVMLVYSIVVLISLVFIVFLITYFWFGKNLKLYTTLLKGNFYFFNNIHLSDLYDNHNFNYNDIKYNDTYVPRMLTTNKSI